MDFTALLELKFLVYILMATAFAMVIRIYDPPRTILDNVPELVLTIVVSFMAAFIVAWMNIEGGMDIYGAYGFVSVMLAAVGGMATLKALMAVDVEVPVP